MTGMTKTCTSLRVPWLHRRIFGDYLNKFMREGKLFRRLLRELEEHERWSPAEVIEWQQEHLRDLLIEASENVPYYRELFREKRINVRVMNPLEVLRALPYLDKETVRRNPEAFRNPSIPRLFLRTAYTSGTTGTPLRCYRDLFAINFEHAMIWRQWRWSGFDLGKRRATLRGELIVSTAKKNPPFWIYSPAENRLIMSSYHMAPDTLPLYVQVLTDFAPAAIEAYPSAVYLMAIGFRTSGKTPPPMKGIFTSSETLTHSQREVVESVFNCPIYDLYGNTERTAAIGQCEHGTYHVFDDYAIVEFLPRGDGTHEIVGTPLFNRAFILLRYRSGDTAELEPRTTCDCKRPFSVVKEVLGRQEGYVYTPDGRAIGRLDHIFKGVSHVVESQIVQEDWDDVRILIVGDRGYGSADEKLILMHARERLGPEMKIRIERVDSIPRGPRGKFVAVVSKVSHDEWQKLFANKERGNTPWISSH
ncbi:MAG: hypothetical protein N2Z21_10635 [Candidatus Sumerlaeaceae bacterium]|nr:hypothetical protein [Candidatus Sumerlaeaceae bacterium]